MNRRHVARLEKLATFLDTLPPEKFNFDDVVKKYDEESKCGTVCCAMGWAPALFPRLVSWASEKCGITGQTIHYTSLFNGGSSLRTIADKLFGCTDKETMGLFFPRFMHARPWNNKRLSTILDAGGTTTKPRHVATSIRNFLRWKAKGNNL